MNHLSGIQRNKMRVCGEKENREIRTITPQCLIKYENLSIFKPSHMFPKAKKSVGPFKCDPKIPLSKGELKLLAKQPKFSVRQEIKEIEVLAEFERMLSKHRFNENSLKEEQNGATNNTEGTGTQEEERKKLLEKLWDRNESRFIFNPLRKSINFNKARPTDYILNKHMTLPKPLSMDEELECEIKRRELMDTYRKFVIKKQKG